MITRRSFIKAISAVLAMPTALLKGKPATGGVADTDKAVFGSYSIVKDDVRPTPKNGNKGLHHVYLHRSNGKNILFVDGIRLNPDENYIELQKTIILQEGETFIWQQ